MCFFTPMGYAWLHNPPPALLLLSLEGGLFGLPLRASNESTSQAARCASIGDRDSAALHAPSIFLVSSLNRVAWSILDCARRTSTFLSCAFREQEDDQATLSPLYSNIFLTPALI